MLEVIIPLAADLLAITAVVSFYFQRHQRHDLMLSYAALNAGVFAVTIMLSSAPVGAGLGLGLFGILSIIRLRSDSITQAEIAYYFTALALGLVAGLHPGPLWLVPALSALLVVVMYVLDHPRMLAASRRQVVTLDQAIADEDEVRDWLADRLNADVRHLSISEVDYVRDLTVVDVRFRRRPNSVSSHRDVHADPSQDGALLQPDLVGVR